MQHNLVAYTLQIHPIREPRAPLRLGWLDGDSEDQRGLVELLTGILAPGSEWKDREDTPDEFSGRILNLARLEDEPTLYGRIRVGGRGQRNDITKASGEEIEVWTDDEVHRPVFFWITSPARSKRALILTERVGQFGVRTAFWEKYVLRRLRESMPNRVPVMAHWYPKAILEEYLRHGEGLAGATLKKVVLEQDENRALDDPARVTKYGTLDVVIKRKWHPAKQVMERLLSHQLAMEEAIELLIPPEEISDAIKSIHPDELLLKLEFDNRRPMTVSLTRDTTPRAGWPVGGVEADEHGYPALEGMVRRAREVQTDVSAALGWS